MRFVFIYFPIIQIFCKSNSKNLNPTDSYWFSLKRYKCRFEHDQKMDSLQKAAGIVKQFTPSWKINPNSFGAGTRLAPLFIPAAHLFRLQFVVQNNNAAASNVQNRLPISKGGLPLSLYMFNAVSPQAACDMQVANVCCNTICPCVSWASAMNWRTCRTTTTTSSSSSGGSSPPATASSVRPTHANLLHISLELILLFVFELFRARYVLSFTQVRRGVKLVQRSVQYITP